METQSEGQVEEQSEDDLGLRDSEIFVLSNLVFQPGGEDQADQSQRPTPTALARADSTTLPRSSPNDFYHSRRKVEWPQPAHTRVRRIEPSLSEESSTSRPRLDRSRSDPHYSMDNRSWNWAQNDHPESSSSQRPPLNRAFTGGLPQSPRPPRPSHRAIERRGGVLDPVLPNTQGFHEEDPSTASVSSQPVVFASQPWVSTATVGSFTTRRIYHGFLSDLATNSQLEQPGPTVSGQPASTSILSVPATTGQEVSLYHADVTDITEYAGREQPADEAAVSQCPPTVCLAGFSRECNA